VKSFLKLCQVANTQFLFAETVARVSELNTMSGDLLLRLGGKDLIVG
jgi:hypothetical protein